MGLSLKQFTETFSTLGDNLLETFTGPVGDVLTKPLGTGFGIVRDVAIRSYEGQQREGQQEVLPPMAYQTTSFLPSDSTVRESGGTIDIPSSGNVFESGVGSALTTLGTGLIGGLLSGLGRGGVGGTVGGLATGFTVGSLLNGGDACGCGPKPFVRADKCGRPIITRKMKKTLIDAINCMGPAAAAQAYGLDADLMTMIISKQFPPRRMGISAAQLATTERTQRKLMRAHKRMTDACKTSPMRRR